jgi:hypothetical protein
LAIATRAAGKSKKPRWFKPGLMEAMQHHL